MAVKLLLVLKAISILLLVMEVVVVAKMATPRVLVLLKEKF